MSDPVAIDAQLRALLPVVRRHAGRFRSLPYYDDLVAAGMVGLWRALAAGKPVAMPVWSAVREELRWQSGRKAGQRRRTWASAVPEAPLSPEGELDTKRSSREFVVAHPYADREQGEARWRAGQLAHLVSQLPPREASLVRAQLAGETQEAIARREGITAPRVSQLVLRATERMRMLLQQEESEAT